MRAYSRIQRSSVDFLLAAMASSLTAFSMGVSLSYAPLGYVFMAIIAVGAFTSSVLHKKFSGKWFDRIGIGLYIAIAFASPFIARQFNSMLPGEGFPRELMLSAAPLIWMLALGSFASWRDQTLLFQCVPCIALFGLVGAFNTFDGATITFFAFLFCASLLYARSHQRAMLERASQSGYPKIESIHGGPWRYKAGPEWGLVSAAVVMVLSVIVAPLIQISVSQVSGVVSMRPPRVQPQAPTSLPSATTVGENKRVGQGPAGRLSEREVFRIKTGEPRYLRMGAFNAYNNGAWARATLGTNRSADFTFLDDATLAENFDMTPFWIKFTGGTLTKLPMPFPFGGMERFRHFERSIDGTYNIRRVFDPTVPLRGDYFKLKPSVQPVNGPPRTELVERYCAVDTAPLEVVELARTVAEGATTDIEKANRVKAEIEKRCKYNLNAEAAPTGEDPIKWFLLGPTREGYCDLFASAMVMMARACDIPARYAVGYYPADYEIDRENYYILREANAHAWAELYFDGIGWVPFDPTEGAVQVPGGERGSARDSTPFYEQEWFWKSAQVGGVALLAVLLGWYFVSKRNAITPEQVLSAKLFEAYDRHVEALEIASNKPKFANESPDEHFERVRSDLGPIERNAAAATRSFATAFYGPKAFSLEAANMLLAGSLTMKKAAAAHAKARRKGII